MGEVLQFRTRWPKKNTKHSLALQCKECGSRKVVEPETVLPVLDEKRWVVLGQWNVKYGKNADSCSRCGSEKLEIMNPEEWKATT